MRLNRLKLMIIFDSRLCVSTADLRFGFVGQIISHYQHSPEYRLNFASSRSALVNLKLMKSTDSLNALFY